MTNSAVLFIIFNRPSTTSRVFEAIKKARPPRLYLACDGPRPTCINDHARITLVKDIVSDIDWECDVFHKYEQKNLGIAQAVYSAINWFFDSEDEGIILEDDCLPEDIFFPFCDEMLNKYRSNSLVFSISGRNHLGSWSSDDCHSDHFFSTGSIWGWATWKRAWSLFSLEDVLQLPDAVIESRISWAKDSFNSKYREAFEGIKNVRDGKVSTWDYPWLYIRLAYQSLNVVPVQNLVANIGGGADATNTRGRIDRISSYNYLPRSTQEPPQVLCREYTRLVEKAKPRSYKRWILDLYLKLSQ